MRNLYFVFGFFLVTLTGQLLAQPAPATGKIAGKVLDKKTGEALIGVTVMVQGTSVGATTDYEGKFMIAGIKPGTYSLNCTYVSYNKKVINGVEVKAKETTIIDFSMEEATKELGEVVIQSEFKKESANALLIQQKNALSVSSGVSADLIRKTPDRTTADVIKRISGASIQDGKFAVVRGLGDRYNMGYLNGSPLPSTESDRKAFSLDIIPASVIDNMQIIKGATPDMPADFGGGIIQINTKDIPDENTFTVQMGVGMHSLTTFKQGLASQGGSTDWLGYDNSRAVPAGVSSTQDAQKMTFTQNVNQTKLFNNNFDPNQVASQRPNYSLQLSASRRMKFKKSELGTVLAYTYNNSLRYEPYSSTESYDLGPAVTSYDTSKAQGRFLNFDSYRNTILNGGVFNVSYKIGANHKLSLKNLLTYTMDDRTIRRKGVNYFAGDNRDGQIQSNDDYFFFNQWGRMFSSQLNGEHVFTRHKIKFHYNGSATNIYRQIPDFRRLIYVSQRNTSAEDFSPYSAVIAPNANTFDPNQSGRFYSDLNEKMYTGSYDLTIPFKIRGFNKFDIKLGGMHTRRDRELKARTFVYTQNDNLVDFGRSDSLRQLGAGKIFNNNNIDSTTYFLQETTDSSYQYTANSSLNAGFAMVDFKVVKRLRVIGGIRVERFRMRLNSVSQGAPVKVDTTVTDWLPSINLIYELTEKINIRGSYAKTLSRPEYREFAPLAFYDISTNAIVTGRSNLVRTEIDNYDLKLEYFPSAAQVFSINPFYKKFKNPVEQAIVPGSGRQITYLNGADANNYGIEFEARTNFSLFVPNRTKSLLRNFSTFVNYTIIRSNVSLTNVSNVGDNVTERPLQGQSPYVFNAGLQYSDPIKKFDVNLTANRIGRRIAFVSNFNYFLVWENPRWVIDASISKTFFNKLQLKYTLGDILAQPLIFYQDLDKNGQYDQGKDVETFRYKYGYTMQLSIGYTF